MRIKVATFCLLFADLILFITSGFFLASTPARGATRHEQVVFVVRSYAIVAVLLLSLFATVILVWVWMQSLREEYHQQAQQNLQALIEGTLNDHERKQG